MSNDWDLSFAHEGITRALVKNNSSKAKSHLRDARSLGEAIAKEDNRVWLFTNLDEISEMIDAI